MNNDEIRMLLNKISDIEKRFEGYAEMIEAENELSFILKGTYFLQEEIEKILNGEYEVSVWIV